MKDRLNTFNTIYWMKWFIHVTFTVQININKNADSALLKIASSVYLISERFKLDFTKRITYI